MLRGIQPTIRLVVSDFNGIGRSRFVWRRKTPGPGTYACRGSSDTWSLKGLSGGVIPLLSFSVHCDWCRPKRISQKPAASRRPPWGGEAIERRSASVTSGVCPPAPETSTAG
ncbi:hypothetical protein BQ8794_90153 [Mesorhizobium prunaredense]|uniref:Uncharacterized protein n=1 Tax=Mesorhizobium prunaredense TaxID=1631249 RepID=A0A1R3VJA8_9HYPH|nr:hypothetical protein BQ8794_90153 [Mesorhizobium prunaredense]